MSTPPDPVFSIVTPTYNMLDYLKCCHASIADQEGVSFEHVVVDGASRDGTPEWLREHPEIRGVSEPDQGMYDALNKGFRMARGELVAYLNCDEQYLPGTLARVKAYFDRHPEVDLVFGGCLLIRPDGSLLSFRKAYPLRLTYVQVDHLYLLSCTLFARRRWIDEGFGFDPVLRDVGDAELVCRLLKAGYRARYLPGYLSTFCMTGQNMSMGENALREKHNLRQQASPLARTFSGVLRVTRRLEKWLHGGYRERFPLRYQAYALGHPEQRRSFAAEAADFRWKSG